MIEFSYKEERLSESKTVLRPVADVIIIAGDNTEVEIPMYIDSGADLSLIPLRFGKALGFTKEGKSIEEMRVIKRENRALKQLICPQHPAAEICAIKK